MNKLEALEVCEAIKKYLCAGNPIWRTEYIGEALDEAMQALREQKAGEWHMLERGFDDEAYCGNCGKTLSSKNIEWNDFKYCPNCGARIQGVVRL